MGEARRVDTIAEIDLHIPESPQIRVMARVTREGLNDDGARFMGVEFLHSSDETEDRIQAALLDEIERSQTSGRIEDLD